MSPLYLSHLTLNPLRREVQRDLADCHNMHRRLLMAFPDLPDVEHAREQYGLLYRVEQRHGRITVLAQSRHQPDWSRLPEGYLLTAPAIKPLDALYDKLQTGMQLAFRLHANPTRRISNRNTEQPERWRGKRVNFTREADQLDWLRRKGESAGFTLLTVRARSAGLTGGAANGATLDAASAESGPELVGAASGIRLASALMGAASASGASGATRTQSVPDTRALPSATVSGRRNGADKLSFGAVTLEGRLAITDLVRFRAALEHGIGSGKAYGFGLLSIAPPTLR